MLKKGSTMVIFVKEAAVGRLELVCRLCKGEQILSPPSGWWIDGEQDTWPTHFVKQVIASSSPPLCPTNFYIVSIWWNRRTPHPHTFPCFVIPSTPSWSAFFHLVSELMFALQPNLIWNSLFCAHQFSALLLVHSSSPISFSSPAKCYLQCHMC